MATSSNFSFTHGKHLFLQEDGSKMHFYMCCCPERATLKPLIEHGGGSLSNKHMKNSVMLTNDLSKRYYAGDYYCFKYILDCVRYNRLLDITTYKLIKYRRLDDMEMANYIMMHGRYKEMGDDKLWNDMEELGITKHTGPSMRRRFWMVTIRRIFKYKLDLPFVWIIDLINYVNGLIMTMGLSNGKRIKKVSANLFSSGDSDHTVEYLIEKSRKRKKIYTVAERNDKSLKSTLRSKYTEVWMKKYSSEDSEEFVASSTIQHCLDGLSDADNILSQSVEPDSSSQEILNPVRKSQECSTEDVDTVCDIVKELSAAFRLPIFDIVFAVSANGGDVVATIDWLTTGQAQSGKLDWRPEEDRILLNSGSDANDKLLKRHDLESIENRALFLENLNLTI